MVDTRDYGVRSLMKLGPKTCYIRRGNWYQPTDRMNVEHFGDIA